MATNSFNYRCVGVVQSNMRHYKQIVSVDKKNKNVAYNNKIYVQTDGCIPYKLVLAVLQRHGIRDGDVNLMIPPFQLTSLIHDIYYACEKVGHFRNFTTYALESATAILSNFFWNTFDPHRRHSVSLLEIKITFLLLCKIYTSDPIMDFYNLLQNERTKYVPKLNFENLLNILAKIFSYIGEGNAYGSQNVTLVIDQCYARCQNLSGLNYFQFHCLWTKTHTKFQIYASLILLIKRMETAEKLFHNNICALCGIEKINGIRFKCQSCKDLSLCLKCFAASEYNNNKHTVTHKMCEVFTEDLPTKKISHYIAKLCTALFCISKKLNEESKGFCNTNESVANSNIELIAIDNHRSSNASMIRTNVAAVSAEANSESTQSSNDKIEGSNLQKIDTSLSNLTTVAANALNISGKLQLIINKLILQNDKLEVQLKYLSISTQDEISKFLNEHQQFLIDIIKEMRSFSKSSFLTTSSHPISSTPNRFNFATSPVMSDHFSAVLNPESGAVMNHPNFLRIPKDNLTHSINGADINRSYLDANKSNYSINDLSLWFNQKLASSSMPPSLMLPVQPLSVLREVSSLDELNYQNNNDDHALSLHSHGTMINFKMLLNKVKEIVEDSYSDNTELSKVTQNLEYVLDSIINREEVKRKEP